MRAGTFSQRACAMPITASTRPITTPMMVEQIASIRVFFRPTMSMLGRTASIDGQSRNVCRSVSSQLMLST